MIRNAWLDGRDNCLRAFLYGWAMHARADKSSKKWRKQYQAYYDETLFNVLQDCRLDKWLGHRKSSQYKWSNSGSEFAFNNTLFRYPTKWIYDKILRHINCDPYKGLNGDQYRAYFLWLYRNRHEKWARNLGLKVLFGFVARLGFTPSFCEWAPARPQAYMLLLKMYRWLYPLYKIAYWVFYIGAYTEMKHVPYTESTTNKICLFPTMYELGMELPPNAYLGKVYMEYFKPGTSCFFIGDRVFEVLRKEK